MSDYRPTMHLRCIECRSEVVESIPKDVSRSVAWCKLRATEIGWQITWNAEESRYIAYCPMGHNGSFRTGFKKKKP